MNGVGEVYLDPDIVFITLGVRTESEEAGAAMDENNTLSEKVKSALVAAGVDEKDIQTTSFNVYWNELWNDAAQAYTKTYVVENMVSVTIRNFPKLSETLDAALGAGANSVYNIRLDVADKTEAFAKARTLAVQNAQKQAAELAVASGVTLGEIISINSYGGTVVPVSNNYGYGYGGGGGAMESATSVPVSGGQLVLSLTVNLMYEIEK